MTAKANIIIFKRAGKPLMKAWSQPSWPKSTKKVATVGEINHQIV